MSHSAGSSFSTRPDLNIHPAVADRPRGSGTIGHGIDVRGTRPSLRLHDGGTTVPGARRPEGGEPVEFRRPPTQKGELCQRKP